MNYLKKSFSSFLKGNIKFSAVLVIILLKNQALLIKLLSKQCGKSPGWPTGQSRQPRIRYPVVKKGTIKRKKQLPKSA
jgi:hypothetical protein